MSWPSSCNQLSPSTIVGTSPPDWSMATPQDQESLHCFSTQDLVFLYTPEKMGYGSGCTFRIGHEEAQICLGALVGTHFQLHHGAVSAPPLLSFFVIAHIFICAAFLYFQCRPRQLASFLAYEGKQFFKLTGKCLPHQL